jgi:hypothetical protein
MTLGSLVVARHGSPPKVGKFHVVLAGDCAMSGYYRFLPAQLGPRYKVEIAPENGKTGVNLLAHTDEWLLS